MTISIVGKKMAVLILGFNHRTTLKETLDSVLAQTYPEYAVTYIDNASSDDSVDFVQMHYPTVTVTSHAKNLGYAGAYDQALRDAFSRSVDAAVLLNPDTVVDREWLAELVASAFASPDIALAQSKILIWDDGPSDRINSFGNRVNFLGFGYCGHYREADGSGFMTDQEIAYASGASLLVKREYYPSRISFDTDFFAYLEDQDLGWQARMQGLRIVASAKSKVWHQYDFQKRKLNNFKFYLLERNRLFFLLKFYSLRLQLLILPAFVIMELGMAFDAFQRGYFPQKFKATWDFWQALPQLFSKRKKIQTSRLVSDRELLPWLSPGIDFEEVDSPLLRLANRFLSRYYAFIKLFI